MAQEVAIVDRVPIEINGLNGFNNRVAIAPTAPLEVVYRNKITKMFRQARVHAFTAAGEPMVLDGGRLVRAALAASSDETLTSLREAPADRDEQPVGPFTPAPAGMVAELSDGSKLPVAFYDVHGRAVAIDRDPEARSLFVLEHDEGLVRIDVPHDDRAEHERT